MIELIGYQLEQDQIRIETDYRDVPPGRADENQIQQVVLNPRPERAPQAMARQDDERVVTARIRVVGATVLLEVLDTGPGIEPRRPVARLFDPFFTTKPPGEGSGLGLSVSYGIVTEHKARLRGENRTDRRRRDLHRRAAGGERWPERSIGPRAAVGPRSPSSSASSARAVRACVGGPVPGAPAHHRERGFANANPGLRAGRASGPGTTFFVRRMFSATVVPAVSPICHGWPMTAPRWRRERDGAHGHLDWPCHAADPARRRQRAHGSAVVGARQPAVVRRPQAGRRRPACASRTCRPSTSC